MNKIIILLLLFISNNAFSACADDFNEGINEYDFGIKYFDKGVVAYNEAVVLSRSDNPVLVEICNKLVSSVSGFEVAKESFLDCSASFGRAISSCGAGDSANATLNKSACDGNQTLSSDNHETLLATLNGTCYKGSTVIEPLEEGILEAQTL